MTKMAPGVIVTILVLGLAVGISSVIRKAAAAPPEPCVLIEPAPIDAQVWLYRGLDACVSKCGPVPFDVEVEPQRVRCNCGRPPNIGVKR